MAAFCTCCGAAITSKNEKCLVCGAPRHGMKIVNSPVKSVKDLSERKDSKDELSIA